MAEISLDEIKEVTIEPPTELVNETIPDVPAILNDDIVASNSFDYSVERCSATKRKLISQIEMWEATNPIAARMRYPASINYKQGMSLEDLDDETLARIIHIQNNVKSFAQLSNMGVFMIVTLANVSEQYIESLKGYSQELKEQREAINECLHEIMIMESDAVESLTHPAVKLGIILGMTGFATVMKNLDADKAKQPKSNNNVSVPANNTNTTDDTGGINTVVEGAPKRRGRPPGSKNKKPSMMNF